MALTYPERRCIELYELDKFLKEQDSGEIVDGHYGKIAIDLFKDVKLQPRIHHIIIQNFSEIITQLLMQDSKLYEHFENNKHRFPVLIKKEYESKAEEMSKLVMLEAIEKWEKQKNRKVGAV